MAATVKKPAESAPILLGPRERLRIRCMRDDRSGGACGRPTASTDRITVELYQDDARHAPDCHDALRRYGAAM
jgi:hypothetical protein